MTTPDPVPLLALRPPPSPPRGRLLPRRIFGRHSLLWWFIFTLTGSFVLLFLSHRNGSYPYSRSKWAFPGKPSTKHESNSDTTDADRKDLKSSQSFIPYETTSSFHPVTYPSTSDTQTMSIDHLCAGFPHHLTQNRIQAVLKIGHGEDHEKIAAQLGSVSACFAPGDLLIFSDMDQGFVVNTTTPRYSKLNRDVDVKVHKAIDVLPNLPSIYHQHPDFTAYNTLQEMIRNGTAITPQNDPTRLENNGWKLDKYKFLAGVERAWEIRPNREWYIFYETDTYIAWDGLFRLLTQGFDPDIPLYLGSPSPGREDDSLGSLVGNLIAKGLGFVRGREAKIQRTWFANGGPGYVLSRGAMRALLGRKSEREETDGQEKESKGRYIEPTLSEKYMDTIRRDCCGDSVLGWALWKAGVKLGGLFPMFNVYAVHGVAYTERMWCQPVLTLHKTEPEDMRELWRWEQGRRRLPRPLLYADLYEFRSPGLLPSSTPSSLSTDILPPHENLTRPNWDNTAYDRLSQSHDVQPISTAAECLTACEQDASCMQYLLRGETCVLMPYISYGEAKSPEVNERNISDNNAPERWRIEKETTLFTAGWMGERIKDWRVKHQCKEVEWLWPSLGRYF